MVPIKIDGVFWVCIDDEGGKRGGIFAEKQFAVEFASELAANDVTCFVAEVVTKVSPVVAPVNVEEYK
jgi:hypothetical protein